MIWRYMVRELSRPDLEETAEALREIGLERWEMVAVLPGSASDPGDRERVLCYFRRDASIEIGI